MSGAGKITLNDGKTLDALGFGTWQSKPGEVGAAVEAALKVRFYPVSTASRC